MKKSRRLNVMARPCCIKYAYSIVTPEIMTDNRMRLAQRHRFQSGLDASVAELMYRLGSSIPQNHQTIRLRGEPGKRVPGK